jgi:hypothetical protein
MRVGYELCTETGDALFVAAFLMILGTAIFAVIVLPCHFLAVSIGQWLNLPMWSVAMVAMIPAGLMTTYTSHPRPEPERFTQRTGYPWPDGAHLTQVWKANFLQLKDNRANSETQPGPGNKG